MGGGEEEEEEKEESAMSLSVQITIYSINKENARVLMCHIVLFSLQ